MEKVKGKLILSVYMSNISPETVKFHNLVMNKLAPEYDLMYAKTALSHAEALDQLWKSQELRSYDTFMFIDIDCVPLNSRSIGRYFDAAAQGAIVGNAQRTNHLENGQHMFAAPSAICLKREVWENIGSPSAVHTTRGDVAEEYTYAAEASGVPVKLLMPLSYDAPVFRMAWEKDTSPTWKLADGYPEYGIGTTFGFGPGEPATWHCFQSFHQGQQERFWSKCAELLGNNQL